MDIVLLTQRDCALCDHAHEILEGLAAEYPVRLSTLDLVTEEGQALAERNGVLFAPGVLIDGEAFSYGRLSERKLRRELDRRLGSGDG